MPNYLSYKKGYIKIRLVVLEISLKYQHHVQNLLSGGRFVRGGALIFHQDHGGAFFLYNHSGERH